MRALRRWAIMSLAVFTTLILAAFLNILFNDYFVYALALFIGLIGFLVLVVAVFCWSVPRYAPVYTKITRILMVAVGSGLLLVAFLVASGFATTEYLIGDGLQGLEEEEQASGKAALLNAVSGCGSELGDWIRRRKFRIMEIQTQPGFCRFDNVPAFQARVQAYTFFMIPTDTAFVQCGSVYCYGPPDAGP